MQCLAGQHVECPAEIIILVSRLPVALRTPVIDVGAGHGLIDAHAVGIDDTAQQYVTHERGAATAIAQVDDQPFRPLLQAVDHGFQLRNILLVELYDIGSCDPSSGKRAACDILLGAVSAPISPLPLPKCLIRIAAIALRIVAAHREVYLAPVTQPELSAETASDRRSCQTDRP